MILELSKLSERKGTSCLCRIASRMTTTMKKKTTTETFRGGIVCVPLTGEGRKGKKNLSSIKRGKTALINCGRGTSSEEGGAMWEVPRFTATAHSAALRFVHNEKGVLLLIFFSEGDRERTCACSKPKIIFLYFFFPKRLTNVFIPSESQPSSSFKYLAAVINLCHTLRLIGRKLSWSEKEEEDFGYFTFLLTSYLLLYLLLPAK